MVKEIRIYLEGGGDNASGKAKLRQGMGIFLSTVSDQARRRSIRWAVVPCGSRGNAFDGFASALRDHPEALNVLLVDSEAPVSSATWDHLQRRDGWSWPVVHANAACHLMVQTMEAWIVADPEALEQFFGPGFNRNAIPRNDDVEEIGKETLIAALEEAARQTNKRRYHKLDHGAKLLGLIDPDVVRSRAIHCRRLFEFLLKNVEGSN
jgi:hypothetical protein